MKRKILYELKSLYRDDFRVTGLEFGNGEKSVCIVGSVRGNEVQQIYTCSQLVKELKEIERRNGICQGHSVLVVPAINSYSMNIGKRFWPTDNTDINRMFPGYALGETTQRIAAGVFENLKDYKNCIQFATFYMKGDFANHVRMMKTGYEDVELASKFGLPYVVLRNPMAYDTTTLNYNMQIWETAAFSLYTKEVEQIDHTEAMVMVNSVLRFLHAQGIISTAVEAGVSPVVVETDAMVTLKAEQAGIFRPIAKVGDRVKQGDLLAQILDTYEGEVISQVKSPMNGVVFFLHNTPMTYNNTAVVKLIP